MQLVGPPSAVVTIRSAVAVLAPRSPVPGKLELSVRPLGSTEVTLIVQLATPGVALGTGVQTPWFDKMSLTTGEVSVNDASTLGSMRITISGAVSVIVAVEVCPTMIEVGARETVSDVDSGPMVSVPFRSEMV